MIFGGVPTHAPSVGTPWAGRRSPVAGALQLTELNAVSPVLNAYKPLQNRGNPAETPKKFKIAPPGYSHDGRPTRELLVLRRLYELALELEVC